MILYNSGSEIVKRILKSCAKSGSSIFHSRHNKVGLSKWQLSAERIIA